MHLEHETIELGLGKLISALLLDGVLRRQNQERIGKFECLLADRDLPLLHRLQQRALHLRRRAVDFVRKDQIGKNRPELRAELPIAWIVDQRADEISRKKVGSELKALKARADRVRQRANRKSLRQAGHPLEEDMTI